MVTIHTTSLKEVALIPAISDLLAQSFVSDTWANYLVPNDCPRQVELISRLFEPSVRAGLLYGKILIAEPHLQGALVAMAPGKWDLSKDIENEVGFSRLQSTVGDHIYERFVSYTARMADLHRQDLPQRHWYLELLGVTAAQRRSGVGAALVSKLLAVADVEGLPTYLETSEERNIQFYSRLGFRILRRGVDPVGNIPYWTLIRELK
jgi:ribosomal protein S18 acetylase RimI-like enzyme